VLEVDSPYHDPADDQRRDELFASHGIRVMRVPAGRCFENPNDVVATFLDWLTPERSGDRPASRRPPRTA
jgi:very-short-patch-repair endonuclease